MSKIRNMEISSLYLALLVNVQHKNLKTFCSSSLWTCLGPRPTSYGHIKKPK